MATKFLVAVDGSEPSQRAVAYAIRLANPSIALHLLTVTPETAEPDTTRGKSLLESAVALVRAAGVTHTAEVVSGALAGQIVKRADALDCDGIIMGTHGMSAIGNLLLGSVATEVIHQTKLPVTLVK